MCCQGSVAPTEPWNPNWRIRKGRRWQTRATHNRLYANQRCRGGPYVAARRRFALTRPIPEPKHQCPSLNWHEWIIRFGSSVFGSCIDGRPRRDRPYIVRSQIDPNGSLAFQRAHCNHRLTHQPRPRPPCLSGVAGHSPPAGVRNGKDWDDPGMDEECALFHSLDIPILTIPYPCGGKVAKRSFASKGGWQASNTQTNQAPPGPLEFLQTTAIVEPSGT